MLPLGMMMSTHMPSLRVSSFPPPFFYPNHQSCVGKFLPTRRTPGVSTSELLERIVSGYRKREFDSKLEKIGHAELKAEGSDFDDSPAASRPSSRMGRAMPEHHINKKVKGGVSPSSAAIGLSAADAMDTT